MREQQAHRERGTGSRGGASAACVSQPRTAALARHLPARPGAPAQTDAPLITVDYVLVQEPCQPSARCRKSVFSCILYVSILQHRTNGT